MGQAASEQTDEMRGQSTDGCPSTRTETDTISSIGSEESVSEHEDDERMMIDEMIYAKHCN
jgi:hypothetical protein